MDPEDPDSYPDHSQNLIISSFYHFGHILKILSKSICQFLSYFVHKQIEGQKRYFGGQWMTLNEDLYPVSLDGRSPSCTQPPKPFSIVSMQYSQH